MTALGDLIRERRTRKNLSYRQAEEVTGVEHERIFGIESGKTEDPRFGTVLRLCRGLGISLETAAKTMGELNGNN